jgi:hypothetical protein
MSNISLLLSSGMSVATDSRNQAQASSLRERQVSAYHAVSQENKLAALDSSELSQQSAVQGQFQFDFSGLQQGGSTSISWQGSFSSSISDGEYTTNFSFSFSISAQMQVQLADGTQADDQQISGQDFSFDRNGLLKLMDELAKQLGEEKDTQADLSGQLTPKLQDLLEKLGLLDSDGKATPALQLLSDYANLNRFKAGQQVTEQPGLQYSSMLASRNLSWQGWIQQSQAAATTETQAVAGNGNVAADDNNVININIINGDHNTVENDTSE